MTCIDKLINEVRRKATVTSFSGVVSVFQGEKDLYSEAFGYADFAEKRKNNPDTKFGIASGTKFFTGMGIGTLIDAGKLSLDTNIREIFNEDLSYIDPRATIAHLLSHTSGIYDYADEETEINSEDFFVNIPWFQLETPSDYLPLFENKRPKFTPGERYSYSNGGYVFLGAIIERITEKLYREYMRDRVFNPVGMDDSGFFAFNQLPENTAHGYKKKKDDTLESNIYNLPIRGGADGGAYTTITDIHKLWRAFLNNRILSGKLTGLFSTPHAVINERVKYGYGMYIMKYMGMNMLFFNGGDAGVGFDSRYIPEKELGFTVISNLTNDEERVRAVILSILGEILSE